MFTNFKNRLIIVVIALSILLPLIVANNANAQEKIPCEYGEIVLGEIEIKCGFSSCQPFCFEMPTMAVYNELTLVATVRFGTDGTGNYSRLFYLGTEVRKDGVYALFSIEHRGYFYRGGYQYTQDFELAEGEVREMGIRNGESSLNSIRIEVNAVQDGSATLVTTIVD